MKHLNSLTFITGNLNKVKWLQEYLEIPITHQEIDLVEIQSLDLKEIVTYKAKEAYAQIKKTVLVEDTSLTFSAMGKLPGPLIKWFLQELGNEGLCILLNAYQDRTALAEVLFGLYDGKELHLFEAKKKGTIADSPEGSFGFGWDSIFIPEGSRKTWGQMTKDELKETSLRRLALEKLEKYLQQ